MATGNITTDTREVNNFDRVLLRDCGELIIAQGERESLTVEAERDFLPRIKTEVRDGTLVLQIGRSWIERFLIRTFMSGQKYIKYYLAMKTIRGLEASGACHIVVSNIETDRLKFRASGAGKVEIGSLAAEKLDIDISGRIDLEATGKVREQVIGLTGSGGYRAPELESQEANIRISGQGNATVWVNETLDVTLSGSGQVEYYGDPALSQAISGVGSVVRLDDISCRLEDRELTCW